MLSWSFRAGSAPAATAPPSGTAIWRMPSARPRSFSPNQAMTARPLAALTPAPSAPAADSAATSIANDELYAARQGNIDAAAALLDATVWIIVPALVVAGTVGLAWNGLSFTAAAEAAGRARSGAAIGLQQTFLSAGAIAAPIGFAAIVHHESWRLAFALAAVSPLVGYALLSPLAERRP